MHQAVPGAELIGSWTVIYGKRDQAVHLWRYRNGYDDLDQYIAIPYVMGLCPCLQGHRRNAT